MIVRTQTEVQQLAKLLLDCLNSPALKAPAKAGIEAGLRQAHDVVSNQHTDYTEINKTKYYLSDAQAVQARAIAVMAVDWLHGENTDWKRFTETLLKYPAT